MGEKTPHIILPDRIYLIGFMGSGKSTAGKRLASRLGYQFRDLDNMIERQYKTSIPLLFEQYDEQAFRLLERDMLHETTNLHKTVIATGGGTPCFFDNMDFINENGCSVYFEFPPSALANRLQHAKRKRPLLNEVKPEQLTDNIAARLEKRLPYYEQAHIIIKGINLDLKVLIQQINDYFLR